MKLLFVFIITISINSFASAVDFTKIDTPYYGKARVSDNGVKPVLFDMYFDGGSKVKLIGPPPKGASGDIHLIGDMATSKYLFWVENDPKKIAMTMNPKDFAKSLGVDISMLLSNGTKLGAEKMIGENCDRWRLDITAPKVKKDLKHVIEACVTSDGIQLQASENNRITYELLELKRGPQSKDYFVFPEGYKVIDMTAIMEKLQGLKLKD